MNPYKDRIRRALPSGWTVEVLPSFQHPLLLSRPPMEGDTEPAVFTINTVQRWWMCGRLGDVQPPKKDVDRYWWGELLFGRGGGYFGTMWPEDMVKDIMNAEARRLRADPEVRAMADENWRHFHRRGSIPGFEA